MSFNTCKYGAKKEKKAFSRKNRHRDVETLLSVSVPSTKCFCVFCLFFFVFCTTVLGVKQHDKVKKGITWLIIFKPLALRFVFRHSYRRMPQTHSLWSGNMFDTRRARHFLSRRGQQRTERTQWQYIFYKKSTSSFSCCFHYPRPPSLWPCILSKHRTRPLRQPSILTRVQKNASRWKRSPKRCNRRCFAGFC